MPLGRSRNKRNAPSSSSSSSNTSTITTIAFVAVCVVGVWMLTSNSMVPPRAATTRTTGKIATSSDNNVDLPSNDNDPSDHNKNTHSTFEDNPGDLPLDALKTDDPKSQVIDTSVKSGDEQEKLSEAETLVSENGEQSRNENTEPNENGETSTTSLDATNPEVRTDQDQDQDQQQQQEQARENKQEQEQENKPEEPQEQEHENKPEQQQEQEQENKPEQEQENKPEQEQENKPEQQQEQEQEQENKQEQQKEQEREQENKQGQEQKQEPEKTENANEKTFEERQEQQQKEDVGIQTLDPRHEVSEEDQQERMKQQQQQEDRETQHQNSESEEQQQQEQQGQQQDKLQLEQQQSQQQEQQQFDDQTLPKKDELGDKKSENGTETLHQKMQQEYQEENKTATEQETKNETKTENKSDTETSLPGMGTNAGIPKESNESKESWSTQAKESENQKERRKGKDDKYGYDWELCNVTAGPDYIPCLDNELAIKKLKSTKHFQHRERHCPPEGPSCLVPLPVGYKRPILWPASRDKIWYSNVPHTLLAAVKGHQNWMKVTGEFLTFPGGGTQFIHGAMHYINFIQATVPNIKWGKSIRVVLDVGCGVASFGGYLFEKEVLTMSFAPKDEHEAQVQFALERGIPAISAVMGSQRLQFPSRVFDLIHCARCRVPWHEDGGMLLLELNRVLRPGGYFVWSATPVYQKLAEDVEIWKAMSALTVSMCWELVTIKKDKLNSVGAAIYRKPTNNHCYDHRKKNEPPMCESNDDPNAAWYVPLHACMHRVPTKKTERGYQWPENWPGRVETPPYWLKSSQMGIYGKPAPQDFIIDFAHWHNVVKNSYMNGLGISWSGVRNVMDMRAVYGGFAAALRDLKMWVMNVVNVDSPDTLPIIYERGLFGIYHDWCESFSTYPRTYDLLHADHLFSRLKKRCELTPVMAEVDRIVRPGGKLIVRDESSVIGEVEKLLKSLRWEVHLTFSKDQEGLLSAQKGDWRPQNYSASPW